MSCPSLYKLLLVISCQQKLVGDFFNRHFVCTVLLASIFTRPRLLYPGERREYVRCPISERQNGHSGDVLGESQRLGYDREAGAEEVVGSDGQSDEEVKEPHEGETDGGRV